MLSATSTERVARCNQNDHHADCKPNPHTTRGNSEELQCRSPRREHAGYGSHDSNAVCYERSRIIEQALSLQYPLNAPRHVEYSHERQHGHRIGRSYDGAEGEGCRPREGRIHRVRRHRDRPDRDDHHDHRHAHNGAEVALEIPEGEAHRANEQEWRHEYQEEDVRRQLEARDVRHQRQRETADDQQGGIWHRQSLGHDPQRDGHRQQQQNQC